MLLNRAHLNQSQQPRNVIHLIKSSSGAAFALFSEQLVRVLWYRWQGPLVIEGHSVVRGSLPFRSAVQSQMSRRLFDQM
jgi:hypothetical protein